MQSQKAEISKRVVDGAPVPEIGEVQIWDTAIKGFFLRVYPSGRRVYALKYRVAGRQMKHTLGEHGQPTTETAEEARKKAKLALKNIEEGRNPDWAKIEAAEAITVDDLIDAYLKEGPATKPAKRASTWAIDGSNLKRHIRPLLGKLKANTVAQADAAKAIRDIADGKTAKKEKTGPRGLARITGGAGTARRTRTTAAAMFAWGLEQKLIRMDANPFAGVKLSAPPVRERFLSREEAIAFLDALNTLEKAQTVSAAFCDALRLLLLTGARKTEVLGLKWSEVDFERSRLVLPPERTKAGGKTGERRIFVSPPALVILAKRRDAVETERAKAKGKNRPFHPSPFVLPAARGEGHAVGLRRAFQKVCKEAKLGSLRVHDLRHSFASFAIADGASLFLIGKLLGHASTRTTERYAHLSGDPLQDAAAMVGRRIMGGDGLEHDESNVTTLPARL